MFSVELLKEGQPPAVIERGPFRTLKKARDAARILYYTPPGLVGSDEIHIVEDGDVIDEVKVPSF
jgi:hypothetical protein